MLHQDPTSEAWLGEERGRGVVRGDPVLGLGHRPGGLLQPLSLQGQTLRVSARLLQVRTARPIRAQNLDGSGPMRGLHSAGNYLTDRSSCVQNFSPTSLLATSLNQHNKPIFLTVDVPVSCSCFVQDFVFY